MPPGWKSKLLLCLGLSSLACASSLPERFDERLTLKSLRDGNVLSSFTFKTLLHGASPRNPETLASDDTSQHYTVFPLALGQILREYAVTEVHLTLNAGHWKYDRWGYPEEAGVGTGAELWAWMGDGSHGSVDDRWKGLRNALSGLFCASLGALDQQRTTSPVLSFRPEGSLPNWGTPHQLRHASLPSENVCTENLTPFLKLLPCKGLSGIASLLNPHRLFDADWHGMGVHVLWHKDNGIEVRLSFQSVLDPVRASLGRKQDWSLRSLFERVIDRTCPVAQSSRIGVYLPTSGMYRIKPEPPLVEKGFAVYDIAQLAKPLDVGIQWLGDFQYPEDFDSSIIPMSVQRTLRDSSQASGKLSVILKNHQDSSLEVTYLETMPWLVQFYLHTLKIQIDGSINGNVISNISYIPAIPRIRPTTFQSVLTLPPRSKVELTMEVAKAFIRYTEHPPDAQRGWDLPPAIFSLLDSTSNNSSVDQVPHRRKIYTPTLLVDLATPDFSMPYNVIIFTCSLIAFLFGSVFNLLSRKFAIVRIT